MNTELGFDELLSLDSLNDASNGYLALRRLIIYPKGNSRAKGKSLSLFLELVDCKSLATERKVYAEYNLRIRDQILGKHFEMKAEDWFSASCQSFGYSNFLPQRDLNDTKKGFLVKDTVIVDAQIILTSTQKDF
ncbi:hypothetical protein C3L33_21949, partial [Rhododendron williamsianum]